jgi:uncharacterized protein (DUF1778 family)
MASAVGAKSERLEARIGPRQKALLKRAADLQGQSLTDFIVTSVQEAAKKAIRDHEIMELTARDQKVLVEALLNPPEPNKKLKAAAERYRAVVGA